MRKLVVERGEVQVKDVGPFPSNSAKRCMKFLHFGGFTAPFCVVKSGNLFFAHQEPADPYWKQVRYLFLQMWGLKARGFDTVQW